ncbi:MAG: VWA domain-containing protein [Anaerolineae bacterium]|nr:VWA domain-containing protein [Anaerolineae bacterium]
MSFATPIALVLFLVLPYFIWLGRPRLPFRRARDFTSLALRLAIVALLILGLAGAQLVLAADKLATIFLVDFSDSMGAAGQQAALDFVEMALGSMGPDDLAGVILFGADALVERPLSPSRNLAEVYSTPLTLNTNMAQAIKLGLAMFPPGVAQRMVVLSDGLATVGDTEAAARLAAAAGVQVDFVSFERPPEPEILIIEVDTPAVLDEGQLFDLALTLQSSAVTEAEITVMASGEIMHQQRIELRKGEQRFVLNLRASEPGFTDFRVLVDPVREDDTFYQNNALSSFSRITGAPRVLVVRKDPRESAELVRALAATDVLVDEIEPGAFPTGLAPLGVYESVVLVNVPASQLSPRRMAVLQVYVRDLGGGLVVIGGDTSYGVGGYYQTPLEETLPVEMQIRDEERIPQVALVFAIDRSGSMAQRERVVGYTHLDLAKEAVLRSIDLLGPLDSVGVVGFDSEAFWVVDLQPASNRELIKSYVAQLVPGGGTSIYAAVDAISKVLPQYDAPIKHVVLLSDGASNPAGIREIVRTMHDEAGVTTSVVAIGENYMQWLERLVEVSGGRFHFTPDVTAVPSIFTAETLLAARSYIVEEDFFPALGVPSEILSGIRSVPRLRGYVATSDKATAQTILRTHEGDPLLAAWQYGLGRAVAWTSDAAPKWSAYWLQWENFARFWSQVVRWTITEGVNDNIEVIVEPRGDQTLIRVDALDRDGRYLNGLDLTARVIDPELKALDIQLDQVAPGRYEGVFAPTAEGAYFIGVAGVAGQVAEPGAQDGAATVPQTIMQTTGWVLSYSPEYRALDADFSSLERIAALTGGRALEQPSQAFDHNLVAQRAPTPLWPWLLLAVVVLLPFDIAVRRLVISRSDWERIREAVADIFRGEPARKETIAQQTERFAKLRGAKDRAAESTRPDRAASDAEPPLYTPAGARLPKKPAHPQADRAEPFAGPTGRPAMDAPLRPAAARTPPPDDEAGAEADADQNIASRLLKRKRREAESEEE